MAKQFSYGLGWRPDLPDRRDNRVSFAGEFVATLPPRNQRFVAGLPEIWNQGNLGSCTAHGILRARHFAAAKQGMAPEMLSRLQLYYDERSDEGTVNSDAGASIRSGIKTLVKRGCGLESLWPYSIGKFKQKPPQAVYESATNYQALKYASVKGTIDQCKAAMASGYPVVIGFPVYTSFTSSRTEQTGEVEFPGLTEEQIGGHCVALNGMWDDERQMAGFDNSYSAAWGDNGCGYLPYAYFVNGMVMDCWVLYEVEGTLPTPTPAPVPPTPSPTSNIITINLDTKRADFPPGWTGTVRKS